MSATEYRAPIAQRNSDARPFGWRDKIGYMFGDIGNNFTWAVQGSFFLIFYTNVMGINAAHVGTLLFAARIIDAFTDVGAGRLIDVARPGRSGRFRPWLLRIMVPVTVSGALIFAPFLQDGSYGARLTWMVITYILWGSVFYTLINIPYGSMASVVSNIAGERASLSVFRSAGAYLAYLALAPVLPLIVYVQIDGQSQLDGWRMMYAAIGCGVLGVVSYLLCYFNTQERVTTPPRSSEERIGFGEVLRTMLMNRALTGAIAGSLIMLIGFMLLMSMVPYVYNEYFNNGQLLSIVNILGIIPVLVFMPFATFLAKRFGKREIGVFGMLLGTVAGAALFLVRTDSPYVFMIGFTVVMLGIAGVEVLIWAIITDVIDFQEIRTGERNDGTVYGMYSWARKLGQALAGGIAGWSLGWIGYESGAGVVQSDAVLRNIYTLSTLVPAALLAVAGVIFALWYPLSRKRVAENVATLEKVHAENAPDA